jgi:peptide/nickel transport system substrate-binding protein
VTRRAFLTMAAAALAAPRLARAASGGTLKFVPFGDLSALDPHWTTMQQTRNHAFLVFDTLFGLDANFQAQPQMVDRFGVDDDGRRWSLRLRPGLKFHDGEPVLARDCVASIRRWGRRDSFGQALLAVTDEIMAADDATIVFRLKRPFPLLPQALGKASPNICVIMPERLARTDPFTAVTEMVGSGPFRYVAAERIPGARVVYERFAGYVPRPEGSPSGTAGPKIVHFDRVEMTVMPDSGTASAALQTGAVDWWWAPETDLLPLLRRNRGIVVRSVDPTGYIGTMRFNQLIPPFDKPAVRRAILGAVQQAEYMQAVVGDDRNLWRDKVGIFCPGTPLANDAGMEVLTGPRDLERSKRELEAAGYRGEKVVLLGATDIAILKALAEVSADLFRRLGINLDYQTMDWGTVVQRRARMDNAGGAGWNLFHTFWSGTDHLNPALHAYLRGNGRQAPPGWPESPRIEALREEWLGAQDAGTQRQLAVRLQLQALEDVPYVPLGQQLTPTAYRSNLTGILDGVPVFWNVRRA